jgi:hypothetical protein
MGEGAADRQVFSFQHFEAGPRVGAGFSRYVSFYGTKNFGGVPIRDLDAHIH